MLGDPDLHLLTRVGWLEKHTSSGGAKAQLTKKPDEKYDGKKKGHNVLAEVEGTPPPQKRKKKYIEGLAHRKPFPTSQPPAKG